MAISSSTTSKVTMVSPTGRSTVTLVTPASTCELTCSTTDLSQAPSGHVVIATKTATANRPANARLAHGAMSLSDAKRSSTEWILEAPAQGPV